MFWEKYIPDFVHAFNFNFFAEKLFDGRSEKLLEYCLYWEF